MVDKINLIETASPQNVDGTLAESDYDRAVFTIWWWCLLSTIPFCSWVSVRTRKLMNCSFWD